MCNEHYERETTDMVYRSPKQKYVSQLTGRPRSLSDGAMIDICNQFADNVPVAKLAEQYDTSVHTIYSVVYWTPRKPKAETPKVRKPVSNEQEFIDKVQAAYERFIDTGKEFDTNDILMEIGYGTPGEVIKALGKAASKDVAKALNEVEHHGH